MTEWNTVHIDDSFLFQQCFTWLGGVRCVVQHFVDGNVPAEGQVYRFKRHHFVGWIDYGSFAGVTDFRGANDLKLD